MKIRRRKIYVPIYIYYRAFQSNVNGYLQICDSQMKMLGYFHK